jgi:hypothetical protein
MMQDPFVGTWKLNPAKSEFDENHRPGAGIVVFEVEAGGSYLMKASGVDAKGEKVAERPQRMIPDGKDRPIPEMRGLTAVCTRPNPNTLQSSAKREDGSVVGEGVYEVSKDGKTLTATTSGFDTQLRQFKMRTVWDRV